LKYYIVENRNYCTLSVNRRLFPVLDVYKQIRLRITEISPQEYSVHVQVERPLVSTGCAGRTRAHKRIER
jgi:hypothetical protein